MNTADWIPVIRDRIVDRFQPLKVILFGSQARGEADAGSDIDLLVVFPRVDDKRRVAVEIQGTLVGLPVGKDILITTPEEIERRGRIVGTVLNSALREGKVIYDTIEMEKIAETRRRLVFSQEDLQAAETFFETKAIAPRQTCWLAQQAVEKSLKAALIFLQIDPARSHDLNELRNLLPEGWRVKSEFPDLSRLKDWAVEARYPGEWAEPSTADAQSAVRQARVFWESIRQDFSRNGLEIEGNG